MKKDPEIRKPHKKETAIVRSSAAEYLTFVAAIGEAIGRLTVLTDQARALRLQRINRVRTIHGSLAIKGLSKHQDALAGPERGHRKSSSEADETVAGK